MKGVIQSLDVVIFPWQLLYDDVKRYMPAILTMAILRSKKYFP